MSAEMANGWKLTQLTADDEIGARIFQQCCLLQPEVYLSKETKDQFWSSVIAVMTKLERAKYHSVRCGELARTAVANAPAPEAGAAHADHTTGVEAEVEAFLFQAKSTLDLLCKTLEPLLDIKVRTFGDKGDAIVRSLRNNVPDDRKDRAAELICLIEGDQEWLRRMIALRDTVGHFRVLSSSGLRSQRVGERVFVGEPVDENRIEFSKTLGVLYFNLLTFCEDFLALTLNLAMPQGLTVQTVAASDRSDPSKPKYVVAMVGPVVER
jgi:hypothetical protein